MTVHVKFRGGNQKKINAMEDAQVVEYAMNASFGDWKPSFIRIQLKPNVVIGQGRFSQLAFQHAIVVVDRANGQLLGGLSTDGDGKAEAIVSLDFVPNDLGVRVAYVPDTEYNRNVLACTLHFGAQYTISDEKTLKEIKVVGDRKLAVHKHLTKLAREQATVNVEASKASLVKGLKENYGNGYAQAIEYKQNVGKDVDRETTLIFAQLRKVGYDNVVLPGEGVQAPKEPVAPVTPAQPPVEPVNPVTPQVVADQLNGKIPTLDEIGAMNNADLKALAGKLELDVLLNAGNEKIGKAIAVHYKLVIDVEE